MNPAAIREALASGDSSDRKLLFSEALSAAKWEEIRTSKLFAQDRADLSGAAEKYRKSPIAALPYSLFKIYDETGSRFEYESAYFNRRGRLNTFAALALLYRKKEDTAALEDCIWAICEEYTWCLPAHLGGSSTKVPQAVTRKDDGRITPQGTENTRVIDLFSAETAFALAEILHLLADRLSPLVVYRATCEIEKRILEPYESLSAMSAWEIRNNNWAGVCAGSVGAAALYLIDDPDILTPLIHRLLGTLECFLSGFGDDGATAEGIGYWEYGFGFFTYFAALLYQRTGGKIDLLGAEKIRRIAAFPQKCYLNANNVASFGDCPTAFRCNPGLLHYLKRRFADIEVPDPRYQCRLYDDTCCRWGHFIRNLVWKEPVQETRAGRAYYLNNAQWMISRYSGDALNVAFAAKGGNNAESHNHNDLGSFLLDVNGEVLLKDLGSGEYTKQYFGPERYTLFNCGSQGHSVPIIDGGYQQAGSQFKAAVLAAELQERRDTFTLNLTAAYRDPNLRSFLRRFTFEKSGGPVLTLTDTFAFARMPVSVVERFITLQKPAMLSNTTAQLKGANGSVDIVFDPKTADLRFFYTQPENRRSSPQTVYVLDFTLKAASENLTASFRFLPSAGH